MAVRDLESLDPARATSKGALGVMAQIYDSLTAVDSTTNKIRPAAARSWSVSDDGLTWKFRIAPATYTDGRPVRARDFKFAFDRIARRATASEAAFQLESVRGFSEAHVEGAASGLSGVKAPTDQVLTIRTERPFAELPYYLSHPALGPIPMHRYGKSVRGLATAPVTNGPFRVRLASKTRVSLVRNDTYSPTPYLDGIEFRVVSTAEDGWRLFLGGEVDVADVPASAVAAARGSYGEGGFTPMWATLSFGFNLRLTKYRDPAVRRAISQAIDRRSIAETVYGNTKDAATGLLPEGVRGFAKEACRYCALNRDAARAAVRAAFGSKRPTIAIDHLNDDSSRQVARTVANDLTGIGFATKLRGHSSREYLALLEQGKHDLAELGWLSPVSSPDGFLVQQLRTGSLNNSTGFSDARFDALVDAARKEKREQARLDLYRRAEARALALMPLAPIVFFRNRTAVAPRVRQFSQDGSGVFDGSRIWIARA